MDKSWEESDFTFTRDVAHVQRHKLSHLLLTTWGKLNKLCLEQFSASSHLIGPHLNALSYARTSLFPPHITLLTRTTSLDSSVLNERFIYLPTVFASCPVISFRKISLFDNDLRKHVAPSRERSSPTSIGHTIPLFNSTH